MNVPPAITRRRALATLGGASIAALLAACGSDSQTTTTSTDAPSGSTGITGPNGESCAQLPQETAGPFPGDGSNGPNVLNIDGVVRQDIRSSIGDLRGTAEGIELTIDMMLTDSSDGCSPLAGAAVYLWQTDAAGRYSLYSDGAIDQNYLRGVQVADSAGRVTFTSVFPGCYEGRWPHIHFAIYTDVAAATSGREPRTTSQLAFPQTTCEDAYADARYPSSGAELARLSLESDVVFRDDNAARQLATMSGSATTGYLAKLTVPA